jgi:hypothetical protein
MAMGLTVVVAQRIIGTSVPTHSSTRAPSACSAFPGLTRNIGARLAAREGLAQES